MNFLSKKVLEYQQKKLTEAENTLQYHISKKEQLEGLSTSDQNAIDNEEKLIQIWTKNVEKLKKEIKKIEEK